MSQNTCQGEVRRLEFTPQHSELVLSLPQGIALVTAPPPDVYEFAAAYRTALAQPSNASSAGARSIAAAGPLLGSPDQAKISECRVEGSRIKVRIVHTQTASARRNIPWRPLLTLPVTFPPGRYTVEVEWQAVDRLPDGKGIAAPVLAGPVSFTL
jgi:hypothetical protein